MCYHLWKLGIMINFFSKETRFETHWSFDHIIGGKKGKIGIVGGVRFSEHSIGDIIALV